MNKILIAVFDSERAATLRAQRVEAREHQREQIQARIDELNSSCAARRAKLGEARQKAQQALDRVREVVLH